MDQPNSLNFSAGPGALPAEVLAEASRGVIQAPGMRQSVLGISHRSDWFKAVLVELEAALRTLLDVGDDTHVLFLQGGGSLQFTMVPLLLLRGRDRPAEYLRTGYWSARSIADARLEGAVRVLYDGEAGGFTRLPGPGTLKHDPAAAYFHYVSNETVEGLQFHRVPGLDTVTRVCDMSSDFLSGPCAVRDFSLIYAHAQKNLGPAGLTVVLVKKALLRGAPDALAGMLDYRKHAEAGSLYNTPPVFAIYVALLVVRWLRDKIGGLRAMADINAAKAGALYGFLDRWPGFFRTHAAKADRSTMNAVFRLARPELEAAFLAEASAAGLCGLQGHRTLGGLRASLYNAVTLHDVERLVEFMDGFRARHA